MYICFICSANSKVDKDKKSEDLSVASWILWTLSAFANTVYSIILGRCELIIASVSEFILITITLILSVVFKGRKNNHIESEKEFNARLKKIRSLDGNHLMLITSMICERERKS